MINLKFLGTGGLGTPRPKNKLAKDYRRFPTLLIDDRIIIDPAEDIFEFESTFMLGGLFSDVSDIFITHSHIDSFSPMALEKLCRNKHMRIFASEGILAELSALQAELIPLSPFGLIKADGYTVLPLPANHKTDIRGETPFNFLIERDGKTVFYGLDGAWINPAAFQVLKEVKLDAVIFECALANAPYSGACADHNNLDMVGTMRDIFISEGAAADSTKFFLSHLPSSKKLTLHDELSALAAEGNFKLTYDGYFVTI